MSFGRFHCLILLLLASSLLTGCAVNRATATVDPSANLGAIKTVHVIKRPDDDGIVKDLVVNKFQSKGYTVTSGTEKPKNVDAWVTYLDRWMWDLTMYMLELTITVRDPNNDYPLASGNSLHTSLTRKSPTEMVDEVVDNIFKQVK
jgi:hypothetical protein